MMKTLLTWIFLIILICEYQSFACTTAIISGKYTSDGRSLLYKHRDSGQYQNKLQYFTDGKFDYIGLINSSDATGNEIWMGCNSSGFAIMNSASYNLIEKDTIKLKDREGFVMKAALKNCKTLQDFEKLLQDMPKPLGVEANFGVIDANGGAAYYETDNFNFVKFDANNTQIAPHGYIIRTNYSFDRNQNDGYGYIRYLNAENLFYEAAATNDLNARFIIQKVSRNLKHSLTNTDLTKLLPSDYEDQKFVAFQDYTPRYSSVSLMVVQGVKAGESPLMATIWTILGFPLCSVAVPTWIGGGSDLPSILISDDNGNAPLCDMALKLKKECFPIERGSGKKYLNLAVLMNQNGNGIMQKLLPLENSILQKSESYIEKWRDKEFDSGDVQELYKWIDSKVRSTYSQF
ncbi:carcinine hydrolase/isopenicillin-N N-acyltransferase family protein [Calditrichota bacterium]